MRLSAAKLHLLALSSVCILASAAAGSKADAKDWNFSDIKLTIANGSAARITASTNVTGLPAAQTAP